MIDDCLFHRATSRQRGHTCWFDTAVITLANTDSLRASSLQESKSLLHRMKGPSLSKEIDKYAGDSEYVKKLHKSISTALSEDVCPLKPKAGQDMLLFLGALLTYVDIPHLILKAPSIANTPIREDGTSEIGCTHIGTMDVDVYLEDNLVRGMSNYISRGGKDDRGILMVQVRGNDTNCLKLDCSPYLKIKTIDGVYELKLKTMTVSEHGHVMAFGRCQSDKEWTVFDNEFSGLGFDPRNFSGNSFDAVKEQMYMFPHTFFSPKIGSVSMSPFFKKGIRSGTVFVYDFVKFHD